MLLSAGMLAAHFNYLAATSSLTPGCLCSGLLCSVSPRFARHLSAFTTMPSYICEVNANSHCLLLRFHSIVKHQILTMAWLLLFRQCVAAVTVGSARLFYTRCARIRVLAHQHQHRLFGRLRVPPSRSCNNRRRSGRLQSPSSADHRAILLRARSL